MTARVVGGIARNQCPPTHLEVARNKSNSFRGSVDRS